MISLKCCYKEIFKNQASKNIVSFLNFPAKEKKWLIKRFKDLAAINWKRSPGDSSFRQIMLLFYYRHTKENLKPGSKTKGGLR